MRTNSQKGLTVFELIITVVAISAIVIIAPIVWQRYARESHDLRRVGAVSELQTALKNYFLAHSSYPLSITPQNVSSTSPIIATLAEEFFIARTHPPIDPESPKYDLIYRSDGQSYIIKFCQLNFVQNDWSRGCDNQVYPLDI